MPTTKEKIDQNKIPLKRVVSLGSAIFLVAGNNIGTGVFKKIVRMAASRLQGNYILGAWLFAAIITIFGAFSVAGFSKLTTEAGGEFEYLRICYGDFISFLFGWGRFAIIGSGAIAAVAFIFSQSFNSLLFYSMVWSCVLVMSGSFNVLTDMVVFASFVCYILLAPALLGKRRKRIIKEKIPTYPLTPILAIVFISLVLVSTFPNNPVKTLTGIALILTGVLFYCFFEKQNSKYNTAEEMINAKVPGVEVKIKPYVLWKRTKINIFDYCFGYCFFHHMHFKKATQKV